jgi:hypothetical protein
MEEVLRGFLVLCGFEATNKITRNINPPPWERKKGTRQSKPETQFPQSSKVFVSKQSFFLHLFDFLPKKSRVKFGASQLYSCALFYQALCTRRLCEWNVCGNRV